MEVRVVTVNDEELIRDLKQFERDFPKVLDSVLRYEANKFVSHVRKNYLSGQMLRKRSGKTQKDVKVRRTKGRQHSFVVLGPRLSHIYEHPGGANIKPKTKKALRFTVGGKDIYAKRVHLARKPFMSTAAGTFNFDGAISEAESKIVDRELKKRGFI
jgi:hypothetical protein